MFKFLMKCLLRGTSTYQNIHTNRHRSLLQLLNLEDRLTPSTFTVSTTSDSGAGSLRQAVSDANAHFGADTIVFDSSFSSFATVNKTIALTSAELAVTESLTITGPKIGVKVARTSGSFRIFNIDDGNPSFVSTVSVDHLTIANGVTTGTGNGGG